jgi:hypothetical protein
MGWAWYNNRITNKAVLEPILLIQRRVGTLRHQNEEKGHTHGYR